MAEAILKEDKVSRRQHILETLAAELEKSPGSRITTAILARATGVSEAALYRHFPSKAKMFEALIEFAEESVFARINRILADEPDTRKRCENILLLILTFAERNPGITRVLLGDVLVGEHQRLQARVCQFFDRLETTFKQVLREDALRGGASRPGLPASAGANLLLSMAEGRMMQFLRSHFSRPPREFWEREWPLLVIALFGDQQPPEE